MASKKTDEWKNESNAWYQQAKQAAETLLQRPAFSYDPGADPLYQEAKTQTVRLAGLGMEDAMGKAAALSGGYASSYAQSLGTQAYDARIARLAERLPDYYDRARTLYDKQTGQLKDAVSTALGLYDKDYKTWLDKQNAAAKSAKESAGAADTQRSYAYRMAMLALQRGLKVSKELLKTAGIDAAYAESIRKWYAART